MSQQELLEKRMVRINQAVSMKRPDRIPVVLEYAGFAANVTHTPMSKYYSSTTKSAETMINAYRIIDTEDRADAINYGSMPVHSLSYIWMSKVKIPGVDLPEGIQHQVVEAELLQVEDYDSILEKGWDAFFQNFLGDRVFNDVPSELLFFNQKPEDLRAKWAQHGIPVLIGGAVGTPYELLCGGRSLPKFIYDLYTIPDKVQDVMDIIAPCLAKPACEASKAGGFPACWVGGWRSASNFLAPNLWERFVWPYLERLVNEVVESGLIAILHLDADWTRDLSYFRSLPKGKCIIAMDGQTDIFKAKEILGNHLCLMGDVPATMFSIGTPDEVYNYTKKLIRELGPEGFILQSGCDIPVDAKLENVQAMLAAAAEH